MNDNLKTALDELYNEESAQFLIGEFVEFSPKFEREIKNMTSGKKKHAVSMGKHAFKAVMIAAAAAAVLGIGLTAGAAATRGFTETRSYSNLWKQQVMSLTAASDENSPQLIEQCYAPSVMPEGVNYNRSASMSASGKQFGVLYVKDIDDMLDNDAFLFQKTMRFTQYTKDDFSASFEVPDYVQVSKTTVNGCPAYLIRSEHYYGDNNILIWDNGDYIMSVSGYLTIEETRRVAESVIEADDNILTEEGRS